jgi:hypothetical protein
VVGVLAGLLVVVAVALGVVVARASGGPARGGASAQDAAASYAAALRDGDAAVLRAAGGFDGGSRAGDPSPWPPTLDQVSLDAQRAAAAPTDVTAVAQDVDDDAGTATVRLRYALDGRPVEELLTARRTGGLLAPLTGRWEVSAPLPRVVPQAPERAGALRLNGANLLLDQLDGQGVPVFSGVSELSAEPEPGTRVSSWSAVLTGGDRRSAVLEVSLSDEGRAAAQAAVVRWLDGCAATRLANPGGCPLGVAELPDETQLAARWEYDRSSWDSARVGLAPDGGVEVTGVARGRYAVDVVVDAPDRTQRVEARSGEVERPYRAEVAIGLDGSAQVRP